MLFKGLVVERIKKQLNTLDKKQEKCREEQLEQEENYKECMRTLDKRQEAMNNAVLDCSEDRLVCLNVGGKLFYTIQRTMSNISPFFAQLFSDKWRDEKRKTLRDKDGNIFIDRSPVFFNIILDWSRNGSNPEDLKEFIKTLKKQRQDRSCKFGIKTFIKTLDYYGIEYNDNVNELGIPELKVGCKLNIYWRGDKTTYVATVVETYTTHKFKNIPGVPQHKSRDKCVVVQYNDGDIWMYDIKDLYHSTGPYSNTKQKETMDEQCCWWHYGEDKGSRKVCYDGASFTKSNSSAAAANPIPTTNQPILPLPPQDDSSDEDSAANMDAF